MTDRAPTPLTNIDSQNQQYKTQVLTLQEQLNLALARRYAASSEKISPNQYRLLDEAETDVEVILPERAHEATVGIPVIRYFE
ncbi:MAG: hypothetical protein L3J22_08675 [Xanthomonadales bacterium]|nr:hypothetical protein [Xanthomonadales bacterium]